MTEFEVKPCPFCGCNLADFPCCMTVKTVRSEEYLIEKINVDVSLAVMQDITSFALGAALWEQEECQKRNA